MTKKIDYLSFIEFKKEMAISNFVEYFYKDFYVRYVDSEKNIIKEGSKIQLKIEQKKSESFLFKMKFFNEEGSFIFSLSKKIKTCTGNIIDILEKFKLEFNEFEFEKTTLKEIEGDFEEISYTCVCGTCAEEIKPDNAEIYNSIYFEKKTFCKDIFYTIVDFITSNIMMYSAKENVFTITFNPCVKGDNVKVFYKSKDKKIKLYSCAIFRLEMVEYATILTNFLKIRGVVVILPDEKKMVSHMIKGEPFTIKVKNA